MVRTQIYLTEQEKAGLGELAKTTGKNQAELIREAVDHLIESSRENHADVVLNNAAGMWKDREDLATAEELRASWDRS